MNKLNYQKELEKIIDNNIKKHIRPRLLLHACCAPCSSYVLEYLEPYFDITVLFYNPNISSKDEYELRANELIRYVNEKKFKNTVKVIINEFDSNEFYNAVRGMENEIEGGKRCFICYRLRLEKTAQIAADIGFDYFCTTLSISPLKNAEKLNAIGLELQELYGVNYLLSDFKKKEGYKRSIELSKDYDLYRQNYCGCEYSKTRLS